MIALHGTEPHFVEQKKERRIIMQGLTFGKFSCVQKLQSKFMYKFHLGSRATIYPVDKNTSYFGWGRFCLCLCLCRRWTTVLWTWKRFPSILVLMLVEMRQPSMNSPESTPPFFLPDFWSWNYMCSNNAIMCLRPQQFTNIYCLAIWRKYRTWI